MDNSTTSETSNLELGIARVHSTVMLTMTCIYDSHSTSIVILAKSSGFKSEDAVFEHIKTDPLYLVPTCTLSKVAVDTTEFVDSMQSSYKVTNPVYIFLRTCVKVYLG